MIVTMFSRIEDQVLFPLLVTKNLRKMERQTYPEEDEESTELVSLRFGVLTIQTRYPRGEAQYSFELCVGG